MDNQELYNFTKWVAANPKLKGETVLAAAKFIKTYLVDLTPSSQLNQKIPLFLKQRELWLITTH